MMSGNNEIMIEGREEEGIEGRVPFGERILAILYLALFGMIIWIFIGITCLSIERWIFGEVTTFVVDNMSPWLGVYMLFLILYGMYILGEQYGGGTVVYNIKYLIFYPGRVLKKIYRVSRGFEPFDGV